MSKQTKLWGVSLLILAFSVNANAQTCKVPPTCESMGFNQTVTSCNGKTILKCPFDETKVYCPSAVESNCPANYFPIADIAKLDCVASRGDFLIYSGSCVSCNKCPMGYYHGTGLGLCWIDSYTTIVQSNLKTSCYRCSLCKGCSNSMGVPCPRLSETNGQC